MSWLTRRWSSTSNASNQARAAAAKSYLEAWVGSKAANHVRMPVNPLLVSGTSYLLATLRLEKMDTPESIAARLQDYPSSTTSKQWKCPIVLDLRAWAPDGSPHYRPPPTGALRRMVSLLDRHGLAVVGVNGTPTELQEEASQDLGLPALLTSNRPTPLKCELDDIIQMVVRRQLEHPLPDEEEPQSILEDFVEEAIAVKVEEAMAVEVEEAIAVKVEEATAVKEQPVDNISPEISQDTTLQDASQTDSKSVESTEMAMPQLPPISPSATVYQGSVRSGQQVCSEKGRSLLILGSVSSGGEVFSDGDIIVLGQLRGRALAGLESPSARIIATSMNPELISVGGVLSTGDRLNGNVKGASVMASLNDQNELIFEEISIGR
jgi:septum site-determining protein MinC